MAQAQEKGMGNDLKGLINDQSCSCGHRWSAVAWKNRRTLTCFRTIQIMDLHVISIGLRIRRMHRATSTCISPANKRSDSGARDLHVPFNNQSALPRPMYEGPRISIPQNPPPLSVESGIMLLVGSPSSSILSSSHLLVQLHTSE